MKGADSKCGSGSALLAIGSFDVVVVRGQLVCRLLGVFGFRQVGMGEAVTSEPGFNSRSERQFKGSSMTGARQHKAGEG